MMLAQRAATCLSLASLLVLESGGVFGGLSQFNAARFSMTQTLTHPFPIADGLRLFDAARRIYDSHSDRSGVIGALIDWGHTLLTVDRNEDALRYLKEALDLAGPDESPRLVGILASLGEAELRTKNYQDATTHLDRALAIARSKPGLHRRYEALALEGLGRLAEKLAQAKPAAEMLEAAYLIWRGIGQRHEAYDALTDLTRVVTYKSFEGLKRVFDIWLREIEFCRNQGDREGIELAAKSAAQVVEKAFSLKQMLKITLADLTLWSEASLERVEAREPAVARALFSRLWNLYGSLGDEVKLVQYKALELQAALASGDDDWLLSIAREMNPGFLVKRQLLERAESNLSLQRRFDLQSKALIALIDDDWIEADNIGEQWSLAKNGWYLSVRRVLPQVEPESRFGLLMDLSLMIRSRAFASNRTYSLDLRIVDWELVTQAREISLSEKLDESRRSQLAQAFVAHYRLFKDGSPEVVVSECKAIDETGYVVMPESAAERMSRIGENHSVTQHCILNYETNGRLKEAIEFVEKELSRNISRPFEDVLVPWSDLLTTYVDLLARADGGQAGWSLDAADYAKGASFLAKMRIKEKATVAAEADLDLLGAAETRLSMHAEVAVRDRDSLGPPNTGTATSSSTVNRANSLRRYFIGPPAEARSVLDYLQAGKVDWLMPDGNPVLMEYFLGEGRSFLWVVAENGRQVYELPPRKLIADLAERVLKGLSAPMTSQQHDQPPDPGLHELGKILLGPAAGTIRGKRLVIVPDGVLERLPFALLPDPDSQTHGSLIENHEITYLPSASALAYMRKTWATRPTPKGAIALFADPVFTPSDPRLTHRPRQGVQAVSALRPPSTQLSVARAAVEAGLISSEDSVLPRLPFTRIEADAIHAYVADEGRFDALGQQANLKTVMSGRLADYKIVHFATHGLLNPQPEMSGLILSLIDELGQPSPGLLNLHDIYKLNLPVELVVLSACQSGVGHDWSRGGGPLQTGYGLQRGFFVAGARRVATSLWKVDDRGAAELMKHFYKAMLVDHLAPSAALRKAQLTMLRSKQWSDPYYWAAFTMHGEPN